MRDSIDGAFHFHSTYSHDGKNTLSEIASTLSEAGLSFCVMTEHFEDLDEESLASYVREVSEINRKTGFVLIPGVEVHLSGVDTIVFPVNEYQQVIRLNAEKGLGEPLFMGMAHPSKYPPDLLARHHERYPINGIEMWNQQAEGGRIPPFGILEFLGKQPSRNQKLYFFGCDLHSTRLTVANVLSLQKQTSLTVDAIVNELRRGEFISRNRPTGVEFHNGSLRKDLDAWLLAIRRKSYTRGKLLQRIRQPLRSLYRSLPRNAQHALNDFKNFVRNKV